MGNKSEIYLAGGCFWGTEHFLKLITGVEETQVGYANSLTPNPTYEAVCTGETNAVETVRVIYNGDQVDLEKLLELFFKTIDPTSVNQQGGDIGTQYRTGIYYTDATQLIVISSAVEKLSKQYDRPLAIEIQPLQNFYEAELYHQDYLDKNPKGYCHIHPDLFELAQKARPV